LRDRGCLVAFEGIEGSGKSTQLQLVAAALRERGLPVRETREPGGTPLGLEIRRLLMHLLHTTPTPLAELLLYLADRAQHLAEEVRPAMDRGEVVLTDRFSDSTIAYQGYARRLDIETVTRLDSLVRNGVSPILTVLLDCPVAVGLRRARGSDRFHREEEAFHERVRAAFLGFARREPERYHVVDSTAPPEQVHREVLDAVLRRLELS
jgi:dTMP kinase